MDECRRKRSKYKKKRRGQRSPLPWKLVWLSFQSVYPEGNLGTCCIPPRSTFFIAATLVHPSTSAIIQRLQPITRNMKSALKWEILAKCSTTKARAAVLTLPHGPVNAPVFMPVGTQGTLKGITPDQIEGLGCQIMLNNTYHLVSALSLS